MELLGKSKAELRELCTAMGEPAYRGGQIYHALYAERKFEFGVITNLPAALRERLGKTARISLPGVKRRFASADGSVRYLFELREEEKKEQAEFNTENIEKTRSTEATEKSRAAAKPVRPRSDSDKVFQSQRIARENFATRSDSAKRGQCGAKPRSARASNAPMPIGDLEDRHEQIEQAHERRHRFVPRHERELCQLRFFRTRAPAGPGRCCDAFGFATPRTLRRRRRL